MEKRTGSTLCGQVDKSVDNSCPSGILIISEKTRYFKVFSASAIRWFLQVIHRCPAEPDGVIHNILWLTEEEKHKILWLAEDFRHFFCRFASEFVKRKFEYAQEMNMI